MSTESLAAQQAALMSALVAGGPLPPGFDAARLDAARRALVGKRARLVARFWPRLAAALGDRFEAEFAAYAATRPSPRRGGVRAEGLAFTRWLDAAGRLPAAARLERLAKARCLWSPVGVDLAGRAVAVRLGGRVMVRRWGD